MGMSLPDLNPDEYPPIDPGEAAPDDAGELMQMSAVREAASGPGRPDPVPERRPAPGHWTVSI